MPKRTDISSILVIWPVLCVASLCIAAGAAQAHSVATQTERSGRCQENIETIFGRAPLGRSRVVVSFTGSQASLMPLYETPYVHEFDVTLFPIERIKFVLTLQVRPTSADPARIGALARQLCDLARQGGARFNGIMLYEGDQMTAAEMAEPEH